MTRRSSASAIIARLGRKVATLTAQVVAQGVRIDELREECAAHVAALERANIAHAAAVRRYERTVAELQGELNRAR